MLKSWRDEQEHYSGSTKEGDVSKKSKKHEPAALADIPALKIQYGDPPRPVPEVTLAELRDAIKELIAKTEGSGVAVMREVIACSIQVRELRDATNSAMRLLQQVLALQERRRKKRRRHK